MSRRVEKVFNKFGRYVVQQSRSNLTKQKKKDKGKLYNSISYELDVFPNSFAWSFNMEDYGAYVDKGVRGAGGVRKTTSKFKKTNNKGKLWKIKGKNSIYKYTKKKPPIDALKEWSDKRGLSPYAVSTAIFHQGLETTNFYSKPFETAFKRLPDDILEAYGNDLDEFLKFSL